MKKFVLKRTCIALLTVFLILLLLFLMLDFMPGSPFNNEEKMSAEQIADLYQDEMDDKMNRAIAVLEPTLVIALSLVVGVILLSVMLPLIGILSAIG